MEGMITRKVELRGVGFFSTFKIYFAITLIFMLVGLISFNLFGVQLMMNLAGWVAHVQQWIMSLREAFPTLFENEILMSFFSALLFGIIVGLLSAIGAGIFSIFASLFGGVKLIIREKNPEKKASYL